MEQAPTQERPSWRVLAARAAVDVTPLREYPAYRRLWIGQAVTFAGSELAIVALPYQLYQLTHSTLDLGLFALTSLVPLLTLTLVGGAVADAFDRRRMLLVTETMQAVGIVGLLVNAALPHPSVAALFVFATVVEACFSAGVAAMRSLPQRLLPQELYASAGGLDSVYYGFSGIAAPALAGVLIGAVGLTWVYAIGAISFAACLVALWGLPAMAPHPDADRPGLRSIAEGFRFVASEKVILGFFLVDTNAMVFGMPIALFPAIAANRFGDATLVGYLYAAPSAGALLAGLGSGWVAHVRRQGLVVVVAATLWGVAVTAFAFATHLWLALVLLAFAGLADQVSAIFRNAMVLALTPDRLQGRVRGIEFMQVAAAPSLGNLEAGVVASVTSIRFSVASGGVLCIAGTLASAAAFPVLLRYHARVRSGVVA
ncbi:MAG: MFS transporter [Actinobacteria bacterium]|nr:MFS transporter [Actinomycetota bacterium]